MSLDRFKRSSLADKHRGQAEVEPKSTKKVKKVDKPKKAKIKLKAKKKK